MPGPAPLPPRPSPLRVCSAGAGLQQMGEQLVGTATNLLQQLPVLAEILPAGGCDAQHV